MALCLLLLALVDASLRAFGLRRTVRWVRRVVGDRADAVRPGMITDVAHAVAKAAAFYPGRAQCLEQSLVLYWVLRRRGVEARLRVGVQPFPFTAHAWVEHNGHPINEQEDFVTQLAPFPSFGA
jgi:transglutaminase-like putative cysteine protease